MNKEYKYINDETIEIKDEKGNLIERKVNCNNPTKVLELENKIETIDNMIKDIEKKINFRKDYKRFAPLWIKIHLLFPLFTIVLMVLSCITGWIYTIYYPFLLPCFVYSIAIILTSIIAGIGIYLASKDINGLTSKIEASKEMKEELEKEILRELSTELESPTINNDELNKPIKLEETLSIADNVVLSHAYSNGFHQRVKRLVRTKNNENNSLR